MNEFLFTTIEEEDIGVLEGETFLRNKHEIAFFEIKCTFFGRKENTIRLTEQCHVQHNQKEKKLIS